MSDACPELDMDMCSTVSPPPHGGCAIFINWCGDWARYLYLCVCMYVVETSTPSLLLGPLNKLSLIVLYYSVFLVPPCQYKLSLLFLLPCLQLLGVAVYYCNK